MKKTLINILFLLSFSPFIMKGQDWQSLGPNRLPKGYTTNYLNHCASNAGNGAFFTIAGEPDNYLNIYASGNNSGIRRSLSTSNKWEDANSGFPEVSTADKIVLDRQKRNGNYSMYACNQWGLFRSEDHGTSWNLTGFNPTIDPVNYNHPYFPTYDPNDEKGLKISEFDVAPHQTDASRSSILANVSWKFSWDYKEESNQLIFYDPGTQQHKNLTPSFFNYNIVPSGSLPFEYRYADIISFPDNASRTDKKFYVKVDKFDKYQYYPDPQNQPNLFYWRPVLGGNSVPLPIRSYILILEIIVSPSAPFTITENWTDITPFIVNGAGHMLPNSNKLIYADIEIMNTPSCSTYLFAFLSGNDQTEQNIMLVSNDYGTSWQKCMGDYSTIETINGIDYTRSPKKYAVSEKLVSNAGIQIPQYIYFYWNVGNYGRAFKTEINNTNNPQNLTFLSYRSLFQIPGSSPPDNCMYNSSGQRNTSQFHADQRDIEVIGDNNNEAIYISDDGGVAVSYNEGTSFEYVHNNEGLNAAHINGISISEDGTLVAAGFHHSSTNYYGIIPNEWVNADYGDGGEVLFDPLNKNRVFTQVFPDRFSNNNTDVSENYLSGNNINLTAPFYGAICTVDQNRPMQLFSREDQLYCGYQDLCVSHKANGAWISKKISDLSGSKIRDFYISPDKTKMYFVAEGPTWNANSLGLFRNFNASGYNTATGLSINGTGYWEDITNNFHLPNNGGTYSQYNAVGGVVVDPVDYKTLYIALKEYSAANSGATRPDRVFKSTNGGNTWSSISSGLPTFPIHKIILDKATETLYIGTSGGVYSYINGTWQEFNPTNPALGKLPKCLVIDLEINQKTRKLYAGAEGYGVWVSDLPCPTVFPAVRLVSQDEVWGEQSVFNEIEIQAGHTLTIVGNLYCTSNVKITVFPGAKLIIDGAKISSIGACSINNWLGIILLGDQYHPQDPAFQGVVELKNGAIIENAINGIIVGDYTNGALNGGIIKADNATFLNCNRDVTFYWYTNAQSTSYFKNCIFKCTQILSNNNGYGTGDYVTLSGIQGVSFSGCTWECAIPAMTPPTNDNRGRGVFGIDFTASFENADGVFTTINPTCSLSAGANCVFKNLTKGIEFERDNQDYHIYVRGTIFENVGIGIDMYGSHTTSQAPKGCVIWGNEFKWNASCIGGMPTGGAYVGVRTGLGGNLKFDNFYIDNNTFTIDQQVPQNIGITIICTDINNSGNYYHSEVFENTCTNSQTANLNHTAVRIQSFNDKLELQCGNHYSGFDHDWKLTGGTANFSLKDQGVTASNNACTNIFTTGKLAQIYVINPTPPMAKHYFRKTASAYNVTSNSTTYLSLNLTLGSCSPSDPCNIGGYVITDGGGNGEGMGFAPNMKPKMDWKNKNELYGGAGNDFYSLDNNNQIKIRPNPASDQIDVLYHLNIDDGSMGEISIINVDGKLVKKESVYTLASIKTIDISNLANGIYQIVLNQNGKMIATSKLVIVH